MLDPKELGDEQLANRRKGDKWRVNSAAGPIQVGEVVPLQLKSLGLEIEPYLVEGSPAVNAMGRRCMIDGCGFHWAPYSEKPYYYSPPGHEDPSDKAEHVVENYVPYLEENAFETSLSAMPGAVGGSSSSASGGAVVELPADPDDALLITLAHPPAPPPLAVVDDDDVPLAELHRRTHGSPSPPPAASLEPAGEGVAPGAGGGGSDAAEESEEEEVSHPHSVEELKAEARSITHMLTHKPKNRFCPACMQAKAVRVQARRVKRDAKKRAGKFVPTEFCHLGTADHFDAKKELSQGASGQCWGLVIKAPGIDWLSGYSAWCKDTMETSACLNHYAGREKLQMFHSDRSGELRKAATELGWPQSKSLPYRSETNAIAERAVRETLDGIRTILLHAGFTPEWWPDAIEYFCFAYNIRIVNGDSAWNKRHGQGHFQGKQIPYGALVHVMPEGPSAALRPTAGPRAVPMVFLGWDQNGGGTWSGGYICIDLADFQKPGGRGPFRRQVVSTVIYDAEKEPHFPLKEAFDKKRHTVKQALPEVGAVIVREEDVDPDEVVPAMSAPSVVSPPLAVHSLSGDKRTSRPPDIWPEYWSHSMSDMQRKAAVDDFRSRHPDSSVTGCDSVPDATAASAPAVPRKILEYLGKHSAGALHATVCDNSTVLWGRMRCQGGRL